VTVDGVDLAVDTGFMVFNNRTYPSFVGMLDLLGVRSQPSTMTFSVSCGDEDLEWASSGIAGVFAQKRNAFRPEMWRMLYDIVRLSHSADELLEDEGMAGLTLGELLEREGFGDAFVSMYLVPMAAAIWSTPADRMLEFPAATFLRFCENHGLLHITGKPRWRTVTGGARHYVRALAAGVSGDVRLGAPVARVHRRSDFTGVEMPDGTRLAYDHLVLGVHGDDALALLADPSPRESELLSSFRYERNEVALHLDSAFLPRNRAAWASWNYYADRCELDADGLSVTYDLTRLQRLPTDRRVLATVNPVRPPREDLTLARLVYTHPCFDQAAIDAQGCLNEIQGERRTWFCGAWLRYGFHEDGLLSAVGVAHGFGIKPPWEDVLVEVSPHLVPRVAAVRADG
jgi:predicted NAD/FAD-binding protein